ncbi:MAG: DUF1501 domain-containing protein [Actinomycetota bacterium]
MAAITTTEGPAPAGTAQDCGCPEDAGITRRTFLKAAGAAGALTIASEAYATRYAFADAAYTGDVLVVLSLRGGFDGLQAIVPAADPDYLDRRPNVGIPANALLQLDATFGMHPALAPLKPLYDAGTLGFVHAVGQAEPNRSHFEAMEEMERAAPGASTRTGWIDRVLGGRGEGTPFQGVQMGSTMPAHAFTGPSPELAMWSVNGFGLDAAWDENERDRWDHALRRMYQDARAALAAPAQVALEAMSTTADLQEQTYVPANGVVYPNTDLGRALKDVARLIKAQVGLQVACVDYGDWDMHAGMGDVDGGWMVDHLDELSTALAAFAQDLGTQMDDVTLVSLTEFGRRIEENGSGGTDHGFGQLVFLLGGGVRGGQVHGQWPGLADDDLIDGDLNGTTDYRRILAEILEDRCGAGSLSDVFPDLGSERLNVVQARVT